MTKEEAIKYIEYCMCEGRLVGNTKPIIDEKWQAGVMAIEALKTQKFGKWIPVTERLPEEAERVLVYAERNAYDDKGRFRKKVIDIGWQVNGMWHIDGCSRVDGIAWMPLPEPYKAESEEKE